MLKFLLGLFLGVWIGVVVQGPPPPAALSAASCQEVTDLLNDLRVPEELRQ